MLTAEAGGGVDPGASRRPKTTSAVPDRQKTRTCVQDALRSLTVKGRSDKKRVSKRGLARGSAIAIGTLAGGIALLWFGIHHTTWLGPALADGARAVVGPSAVAWIEDVAYGIEDKYNQWRFRGSAPVSYWTVPSAVAGEIPSTSPIPSAPSPIASATNGPGGAKDDDFPPSPCVPPFENVADKGDGVWIAVGGVTTSDGRPILAKAMIHPDPKRSFAALAIVVMDLRHVQLHAVPGTVEPRAKEPPREQRPGLIHQEDLDALVAAFNGGFQTIHGHYSMMADGVQFGPPRANACTVGIYRDGSVRIRSWPEVEPTVANMVAFRQTPQCLVEQGQTHPALHSDNTHWGAAVGGLTVIRRSALGLSASGQTLFFGMGDALTAKSIGEGMKTAGAHDVAELDVNYAFPRFIFYEKKPSAATGFAATGLVPGFTFSINDYIKNPSYRDFFYVTRRTPTST